MVMHERTQRISHRICRILKRLREQELFIDRHLPGRRPHQGNR